MISWRPEGPIDVPDVVTRRAAGRPVEAVWRNELGGLTFRIGGDEADEYMKWQPSTAEIDLAREARKLAWAVQYATVPTVLELGRDDGGQWLITSALPGLNAVEERWRADPEHAVVTIGSALRRWHDRVPVQQCPFTWTAASRIAVARQRHLAGTLDVAAARDDFGFSVVEDVFAALAPVPSEDLVVCHGDACAPNTLIGDDGTCTGHVDLGQMGVGDRWADVAIAAWSTVWNYGEGFEDLLYSSYGVARDEGKIRFYRLLWDVG